jgi:hypothetical protein
MQKRGKTTLGKQRWYCKFCRESTVVKRKDLTVLHRSIQFNKWLTGNQTLSEISFRKKVVRKTLTRRFSTLWHQPFQTKLEVSFRQYVYIVDGVYIHKRECCVLVVMTPRGVVGWVFVEYENLKAWVSLFKTLKTPLAVVCDGQKGLSTALKSKWPNVRVQRCLAHLLRSLKTYLTQNPKTKAGLKLQKLTKLLVAVWTRRQKRRWLRAYFKLFKKYLSFLKEKTHITHLNGTKNWWYTHRSLRSAFFTIKHSLPEMFTYIGHYHIPRTSNYVEGGINSRLKELVHRHRGLSVEKKKVLVNCFLTTKMVKKPPQNVP